MTTRSGVHAGCAVVAAVLAVPVAGAPADAAAGVASNTVSAGRIADVVITAERRPDTVQAVPMAVTAIPAAALSARNLDTSLLIANTVPNMFASNAIGLGSANTYTLRGLGQDQPEATFSPAVATFIDDIYFGRTNGSNFRFFDIDRAEVLRGSQGTLHGRNTLGGAIRIVNNRPSETLGGFGEFAYGAFDRKLVRGSLDLPASAAIQVKLSGYYLDDDGYVENTTTGETLNDSDAAGLRGAVQLKITDTLRWNVAATYMRNDGENLPNLLCDPNAPTVCNGRYSGTDAREVPVAPGTVPGNNRRVIALGNRLDTQLYTSHIEWAGENFAVSSITGFLGTRERSALDLLPGVLPGPGNPVPLQTSGAGGVPATVDGKSDQFSQELKLVGSVFDGRVDYIVGALYTDETNVADTGATTISNATTDKAAYGQVDVNATSRLKLSVGIRFTDERTRFALVDNAANRPATLPATTITDQFWTPRVAVSYRAANAVLAYVSAARGFRSGGWDARSTDLARIRPFLPETAWTYEGGIKADALGGRLRANLVAFWVEGENSQAPLVASVGNPGPAVVQNIDGFRNRGIEVELTATPVSGLNLSASLGYQNARYKVGSSLAPNRFGFEAVARQQADCAAQLAMKQVPLGTANNCAIGIVDANGAVATPPRSPDFNLAIGGAYDWPIPAAGIILTPSATAVYRSAFETESANATLFTGAITDETGRSFPANPFAGDIITGSRNPAVWQVAAALTLRTDDSNWTLALECENCLDTAFTQTSAGLVSFFNPPRVWQIRARRAF
jgi:iron complex outermembrane receptor protein